jgi:hypothetical protein
MFAPFQNVYTWLTLLALTQGIVWSLAAWPATRMFILSGVLIAFLCALGWRDVFGSVFFLAPTFLLGFVLSGVGMKKMRHGQWQGCTWKVSLGSRAARAELRQARFSSPARAQMWFEWRRFGRRLCYLVAIWAFLPVIGHVLVRAIFMLGPLQQNTLSVFLAYLLAIPVVMHFLFSMAPPRGDLPFLMNRPLTNGQIMIATLQTTAITTLVSWAVIFLSLGLMPALGDFHGVLANAKPSTYVQDWTLLVLGLMLLTWRSIPCNLGFVFSGHKRLSEAPVWMLLGLFAIWIAVICLNSYGYWDAFWRLVPAIMIALIAAKIGLAIVTFRLCLQRRLLSVSTLVRYVTFWVVLVAVLLAAVLLLAGPRLKDTLPTCLAVVLLVPLARIGFCPIAFSWNRHA